MSVITINDPNSTAFGSLSFMYDQSKPRVSTDQNKRTSLLRINEVRKLLHKKPLKRKDIHSHHHLNHDRSCGHPDNFFATTSRDQHNHLDLQSTELFTTMFNMGKIGFDYITKKYFIASKQLEAEIKKWKDEGSKLKFDIRKEIHNGTN